MSAPADIERIERELRDGMEGVTPGPWRMHVPDRGYCYNYLLTDAPEFAPIEGKYPWRHLIADFDDCERGEINAAFIARCSPENIRALLDEIARLREVERKAQEDILAVYDECERVAVPADDTGSPYRQVEAYRSTIRKLKARAFTDESALSTRGGK